MPPRRSRTGSRRGTSDPFDLGGPSGARSFHGLSAAGGSAGAPTGRVGIHPGGGQGSAVVQRPGTFGSGARSLAANLGWLFDGFETYALILTAGVRHPTSSPPAAPRPPAVIFVGVTIAVTLLGWGLGGILGGIFADYFGRRSALLTSMIVVRGVHRPDRSCPGRGRRSSCCASSPASRSGPNGEPALSLVAEMWPARARAKVAGLFHAVRARPRLLHRLGVLVRHRAARARLLAATCS